MRIRFLPKHPQPNRHFMSLALERLGWPRVPPGAAVDLGFKWRDATRVQTPLALRRLARRVPVLNLAASDIGKHRVHAVYGQVFGREIALDPRLHEGLAVRKSEANYRHDGVIVPCPLARPEPGFVYSRLVDNSRDPAGRPHSDLVFDLRTPFFRGVGIPYVLVKYKRRALRFGAGSTSAPDEGARYELLRPEEVFEPGELAQIDRFCAAMGVDVCELDVLRDADGTPYIVDVNWTPAKPTRTLTASDRTRVIDAWSEALEACVGHCLATHTPATWRPRLGRRGPSPTV